MKKMFAAHKLFPVCLCLVLAATGLYLGCRNSTFFRGPDGSRWKLVNTPGFGNDNNSSVVAMAEYKDYLYAMTRNKDGAEVWRMDERDMDKSHFPTDRQAVFTAIKRSIISGAA